MNTYVHTEFRGNIALVTLDYPPVNALGQAVRAQLLDAAGKLAERSDIRAVVVAGAHGRFVAGADLREMGQPSLDPQLPDLYRAIEQSPVPWIAAIDGAALGGGLELALACRGRIASLSAIFGLPEVTLGIIPGAGGTVRLPRVIALDLAVEMVTSGKPVDARTALAAGLIDLIAEQDLIENAIAYASVFQDRPGASSGNVIVPSDTMDWDGLRRSLMQRGRGQQSLVEALEAMLQSSVLPVDQAFAAERERFLRLRASDEAAALRHVFFAERNSSQPFAMCGGTAVDISKCGVVGGGTMGAGIATALLLAGSSVTLIEQDMDGAQRGRSNVEKLLSASLKRGVLNAAQHAECASRLMVSDDYRTLSGTALVIEAVFEDMQVKRQVFAALDNVLDANAIIGTNTSYLDVTELAECSRYPERVIGLHFFSPAHIMKLLEVVRTPHSNPVAMATAQLLAKKLRKTAVVSGVCDGFIGNRIMAAYRAECEQMLLDGASPQIVDQAMRDFGFAMGIFETQDMSGLDIAWAMRKRRIAGGQKQPLASTIADHLCEAGHFGRKSGRGWYVYDADGQKAQPNPDVGEIAEHIAQAAGISRRDLAADAVVPRILARISQEAQAIMSEGIAASAADIDVVMITGYGFPRFRGGPLHYCEHAQTDRSVSQSPEA